MDRLFLQILNVSITAAWMVPAVMVLRLLLKKAPRWASCLLWALVAVRLLVPFSFESPLSLLPSVDPIPQNIATVSRPAIRSGIPALNEAVNPLLSQHFSAEPSVRGNLLQPVLTVAAAVWLTGMAAMLLYSLWSVLRLRRRVKISLHCGGNVYVCDDIDTPFILGVLRPRIYIPSGVDPAQMQHVLAHERAHLKRGDHLWKPLGFFLLSVHWFNPLLWVAYILLSRDIEQACDEKVIRAMDDAEKRSYSEALLACSSGRKLILACPLAFGEVSVKERIKGVLTYKRPVVWMVLGSVAACALAAVCFLTDPLPCNHHYESAVTLQTTCAKPGETTFTCIHCKQSHTQMLPVRAHEFSEDVVLTAATCTVAGKAEHTCQACGLAEEILLQPLPHNFGDEAKIVKGATCIHTGIHEYTCIDCGAVGQREVPTNDNHAYTNQLVRAATCTDPGEGIDTCVLCGKTQTVTYELVEHKYKMISSLEASCSREGEEVYQCSGCGDKYYKTLPKNEEHSWRYEGYYLPEQCWECLATNPDSKYYKPKNDITSVTSPIGKTPSTTPQLPVIQWAPNPGDSLPSVTYPTVKIPGIN